MINPKDFWVAMIYENTLAAFKTYSEALTESWMTDPENGI